MELIFNESDLQEKAVTDKMEEAAVLCLAREGVEAGNVEISVSFVSEEEIKELNNVYRNNNSVTDVLSFPQYDDLTELDSFCDDESGETALGDVVICTDRARQQAEEFGHSFERELVYLFVHSMFHLLGYDHMEPEEKSRMREAEEEIMEKLDLVR